jgi:hypothetical protein
VVSPNADPDTDGRPNLLEFAYATLPKVVDALPNALTLRMGTGSFTVTHPENSRATGISIDVQLLVLDEPGATWRNLDEVIPPGLLESMLLPPEHPERRWREVTFTRLGAPGRALLRLRVSRD